jgi:hypothetical protein
VLALIPSVVSYLIQKYRYREYEKQRKEKRFKQTHRRELLHFIKLENEFLQGMEKQSNSEMYTATTSHAFDSATRLYQSFSGFFKVCAALMRKRKERAVELHMSAETLAKISAIVESKALRTYAKNYPEFYSLRLVLQSLVQNPHADVTDREQELLDEIEEISKPHLKAVVLTDPGLVDVYNQCVDLYADYRKKQERIHALDNEMYSLEREFTEHVKELAKSSETMQTLSKTSQLAALYNNIVTLFNHYTKKQQLKKAIEGL